MEAFDLIEELKKHNVLPKESIVTNFDILEYICSHVVQAGDFSINLDVYEREVVDDSIIVWYQCVENHISNEKFLINVRLGFTNREELYFNLSDIIPYVYEGERDEAYFEALWLEVPFVYHNQLLVITGLQNAVFCSKIADLPDEPMPCRNEVHIDSNEGGIAPEKLMEYLRYWNK